MCFIESYVLDNSDLQQIILLRFFLLTSSLIRNFRDSGAWFPHLANAGKYLTSLAVVALNVLKTNYKSNNSNSNGNGNSSSILKDDPFLLAWLVVIVTSSLYG